MATFHGIFFIDFVDSYVILCAYSKYDAKNAQSRSKDLNYSYILEENAPTIFLSFFGIYFADYHVV